MPDITYPAAGGRVPGYLATPQDGSLAGIVIIQDVLGLTSDLKRIADRFAANGYLALAPSALQRSSPEDQMHDQRHAFAFHRPGRRLHRPAGRPRISRFRQTVHPQSRPGGVLHGRRFLPADGAQRPVRSRRAQLALLPKDVDVLRHSCPVVASFGAKDPIVAHAPRPSWRPCSPRARFRTMSKSIQCGTQLHERPRRAAATTAGRQASPEWPTPTQRQRTHGSASSASSRRTFAWRFTTGDAAIPSHVSAPSAIMVKCRVSGKSSSRESDFDSADYRGQGQCDLQHREVVADARARGPPRTGGTANGPRS